ncbi:Vitamin B12-binding protein precursor [compost metagenome]
MRRASLLLTAALLSLGVAPTQALPAHALKDTAGKPVARSSTHRIISLSPATTEILFAIGAGPMVVAISDYCNFPPEVATRPRVGAVMTLNLEKTLSLRPDLFITTDGNPRFYERLDRLSKAQIVQLSSVTLASVAQNVLDLGGVTGREAQAEKLAGRIRAGIQQATQQAAKREKPPRVFYMVWGEPLITAGPGSYLDDLIRTAGGENAVRDLPPGNPYPPYSWEALVAADPDVILAPEHLKPTLDRLRRTQKGMKAVKSGRIILLDDDIVSRPGPRVLEALDHITKALYP